MHQIDNSPATATMHDILHAELLQRRRLLVSASAHSSTYELVDLLDAVEAALVRISDSSFGTCDVCKAPIETEVLLHDPLARLCLDCLPVSERRMLEKDLAFASTIQSELLPDPDFETPDWAGHYSYTSHGPVSGDFCDVIPDQRGVLIVFGDISGKGVSAALLMSHLSATFRVLASSEQSLVDMMNRANRMFCEASPLESFATLVAIRLSPNGEVEIANAGHVPPLLHNGRVHQIPAQGVPIGLFRDSRYTSDVFRMESGDRLVLVTDGAIESTNGHDDEFGMEALVEAVASAPRSGPRDLVRLLLEKIDIFRDGRPATDDTTLMVVQRS